MASTLAERAEQTCRDLATAEADARHWLAEAQRPISRKGKRIALDLYCDHDRRAVRLRDALAQLTAEAVAEGAVL